MEIAVRLGGETGSDAAVVFSRGQVLLDDISDEIFTEFGVGDFGHGEFLLIRRRTASRPRTAIISNKPAPLVLPLTAIRVG
jgi:hypothetical protein